MINPRDYTQTSTSCNLHVLPGPSDIPGISLESLASLLSTPHIRPAGHATCLVRVVVFLSCCCTSTQQIHPRVVQIACDAVRLLYYIISIWFDLIWNKFMKKKLRLARCTIFVFALWTKAWPQTRKLVPAWSTTTCFPFCTSSFQRCSFTVGH